MGFGLRVTGNNVSENLTRAQQSIGDGLGATILRAANIAGGFIARSVVQLLGGTGNLAGSFLPARFIRTSRGSVAAGALSDEPHARVQDQGSGYLPGGVITPNEAKNLAIPITPAAKAQSPRDMGDQLKFMPLPVGGMLIDKVSDQAQYILKPEVKITGVEYLKEARNNAKSDVVNEVRTAVVGRLRNAMGGS